MILVDSSVWIDFLRGVSNSQSNQLAAWLLEAQAELAIADLVIFEVMRGIGNPREKRRAKSLLLTMTVVEIGGVENALQAAEHYSQLRAQGYTIASPIDVLQASFCIAFGHILLHRDADFDVLGSLRGLKAWSH